MDHFHGFFLAFLLSAAFVQDGHTFLASQAQASFESGANLNSSRGFVDDSPGVSSFELSRWSEVSDIESEHLVSELKQRIAGSSVGDGFTKSNLPPKQAVCNENIQNPDGMVISEDTPGIWITISQRGLKYLKDVLLTQILQAITPLDLPDITKTASFPFVGEINASFTNVTLVQAEVPDSTITLGNSGVAAQGSKARANLTLNWHYRYSAGWLPNPITDGGEADIKVEGMQAGVSLKIQEQDGGLNLIILQCGTYIGDLEVQLHGDSSWIYQWLIDELEERIRLTIEDELTAQVRQGVQKLNSLLHELPQKVPVDEVSELNFTVAHAPVFSPTSISIGINGSFISLMSPRQYFKHLVKLPPGLVCNGDMKMITIALSDSVLNSAGAIYYNASLLNWLVEKMADQTFLNTSRWKYVIPQLYQQYPNKDMKMSFEVPSPPNIAITLDGIKGTAAANMIITIVDNNETIPVACISITASVYGWAGLAGNNMTGQVGLNDLSLNLDWSNVGNIHLVLVKVFVRTLVKDALLPLLNLSLRRGFPLPIVPSVELRNAHVKYGNGFILVCTDVQYVGFNEK